MLKHACLVQHFRSLTVLLRDTILLCVLCASSELRRAGVRTFFRVFVLSCFRDESWFRFYWSLITDDCLLALFFPADAQAVELVE